MPTLGFGTLGPRVTLVGTDTFGDEGTARGAAASAVLVLTLGTGVGVATCADMLATLACVRGVGVAVAGPRVGVALGALGGVPATLGATALGAEDVPGAPLAIADVPPPTNVDHGPQASTTTSGTVTA